MNKAVDSVIRIPCDLTQSFFRYWFEFLKPFHNLTEREIDVAAAFVKRRFELSKKISDIDILDSVTMNEESKKVIMAECNITMAHLQVIMSKLKKCKIFVNGKLNPRYIPSVIEENGSFRMLFLFEFK